MDAGIVGRNLTKAFQQQVVLEQVDIDVSPGSTTVLAGPSGVGKTTLLRIIAGLELPDKGEVYLSGALATTSKWSLEPWRRDLGFVFQNPTLWPHMTVKENILFGLEGLPRLEAEGRATELLEQAGISGIAPKYPDQISGGEAKRVALVRSLAPRPRYLLVDEPLVNLDKPTKDGILEFLLAKVAEFQMTMLYVTHDADEIARIGGRIVTLQPTKKAADERK